jgi:outer membrane cobalamin receptor
MKHVFILCLSTLWFNFSFGQGYLSGKITDKVTSDPVIGAYILLLSDPSIGTVSDLDGNYSLELNEGEHQIIYKFSGMLNDTLKISVINGQKIIQNITLAPKTLGKIDIVVGKFDKKVEELTFSMEVIKPSIIENTNTRSIESILDRTPGLNIMDGEPQIRGGSGFTFGVGSKVSVLVDDMPMLSGDAGRPEWGFIPVENIEQIEITKGASSVLSGSSALSGSIHIRTAYPKDVPMTKINSYTGFYSPPSVDSSAWWQNDSANIWGNYAFIHGVNFMHSRIIKKNTDLVLGANLNWDHGYIGGPIKGPFVIDTLSEEFTDKQMQSKKARFNFNLRHRSSRYKGLQYGINGNAMFQKTNLVFAWLDDTSGIYRAYPGAVLLQDQLIFNVDPYVVFASKIGVKHSLRTRMMYTDNKMTSNQSNLAKVFYADYQFKKEFKFLQDKSFDFIGGLSSQYSFSRAQIYAANGDQTNYLFNLSAYAEVQKDFYKIINFSMGGRAEYFQLNDTITEWNPIFRSGINVKMSQATYVRASFGQGYRFPTITERYIRTSVGSFGVYDNPNLVPERSWNAEVGVNQGFKIGKYMGKLDVAAFIQEYRNTIEYLFGFWDPNPNYGAGDVGAGFRFLNTGRTRVTGFDVTLMATGKIGKKIDVTHSIGYNYINPITLQPDLEFAQDFNPNTTTGFSFNSTSLDTTTNVLKYRFKHTVKADIEFAFYGFRLGYTIKYFSKMENLDRAITDFEQITVSTSGTLQAILYNSYFEENNDGNIVHDLRVSYEMGKKVKHKFAVIIKNLLNSAYSLRPLKIEQPRSSVFQYSLSF